MEKRLVLCESCGAEEYFSHAGPKWFFEIDYKCPKCGENHYYGEIEVKPLKTIS